MLDLKKLKSFDVNGYTGYYIPGHHLAGTSGIVYEHMIMAEELLKRNLNPGETVHHKDKDRKNNSVDNLMVFKTAADHTAFHNGSSIVLEDDVYIALNKSYKVGDSHKHICPMCGGFMDIQAIMCLECRNKERAKNIPAKEELYKLLRDNSMCAIGKIYGVSDNAVRKWCRKYGLPFTRKDIKDEFGIMK